MKKIIFVFGLFMLLTGLAFGQMRAPEKSETAPHVANHPAPGSFEAKYEGGMYGFSQKEEGTLKFDDENGRLVFYGKDQREKFHVPYDSMMVVYPESKSVQTTTGTVISVVPLPGAGLASFWKEKRRFLVINFEDPEAASARGTMSFKLDSKELLDSVIHAIGEKAKLAPRGDAYYRPKSTKGEL